jgi:hypothetical protein
MKWIKLLLLSLGLLGIVLAFGFAGYFILGNVGLYLGMIVGLVFARLVDMWPEQPR